MNEARLKECLEIWRDWMRQGGVNIGYPKQSLVISSGGINCWDDWNDAGDSVVAGIVDAAMTDIKQDGLAHVAAAVEMSLGLLPMVFTYRRMRYEDALELGHKRIYRKLQSEGMA